jgi:outer membrane protein TolC
MREGPVGRPERRLLRFRPMRGQAVDGGAQGLRVLFAALPIALIGCASPLGGDEEPLEPQLDAWTMREIAPLATDAPARRAERPAAAAAESLAERRGELEALGPATSAARTPFDLGPDLTGAPQEALAIELESAVRAAVANDLLSRQARLQTAISREDVIGAQAAFDFVLFGSARFEQTDEPQAVPIVFGTPIGSPFNARETTVFETGVRRLLQTGGTVSISTDITRLNNESPGVILLPDPAYTTALRAAVAQPLLRGFGEAVTTASIRLAASAERRTVAELERDLLQLAADAEIAYWNLVLAWRDVEIAQWLVDVGVDLRDKLADRRIWDTKPAEYSDAVARVEQRNADVIRARRAVRAASDALKALIDDPELSVGSEVVLRPVDEFVDAPLEFHLRDAIATSLARRPEIRIARSAIDDSMVGVDVADNGRLPRLDFGGQVAFFGIEEGAWESFESAFDDQFVDYVVGVTLEYPLGNRGPDAAYRRSRLVRSQALLGYRQAIQDVVLDVKAAMRDVVTNYELIGATMSFRVAQAENLRTLEAEELMRGLTPEALNLRFQRQETLAQARREELQALANLDQSIALLHRAIGTGLTARQIGLDLDDVERGDVAGLLQGDAANR